MERLPDADRPLVMSELVRVRRGAEAIRAALGPASGSAWRSAVGRWQAGAS